jgi:hypothetical protein
LSYLLKAQSGSDVSQGSFKDLTGLRSWQNLDRQTFLRGNGDVNRHLSREEIQIQEIYKRLFCIVNHQNHTELSHPSYNAIIKEK